MKKLTVQEALTIISQAISHSSLKLSKMEHVAIENAYTTIENELKPKDNEVLIPE